RPHRSTLFPYTTLFRSTSRIEEAKHALLIAGEVCGQQRDMAVDLGGAGTNYRVSPVQRIGRADAGSKRGSATDGLCGQACAVVEDRKSTRLNSSHVEIS